MSIQYVQDQVSYSMPAGQQTDYEATISIVFSVNDSGTLSPEYVYTLRVTGGTSMEHLLQLYSATRQTINDATLAAYAAGTPTTYTPPTPTPLPPI